jgi:hypothetical protein
MPNKRFNPTRRRRGRLGEECLIRALRVKRTTLGAGVGDSVAVSRELDDPNPVPDHVGPGGRLSRRDPALGPGSLAPRRLPRGRRAVVAVVDAGPARMAPDDPATSIASRGRASDCPASRPATASGAAPAGSAAFGDPVLLAAALFAGVAAVDVAVAALIVVALPSGIPGFFWLALLAIAVTSGIRWGWTRFKFGVAYSGSWADRLELFVLPAIVLGGSAYIVLRVDDPETRLMCVVFCAVASIAAALTLTMRRLGGPRTEADAAHGRAQQALPADGGDVVE